MAADLDGWLAPNRIYPGVAEAMQALMQQHEVYIVTTKQARMCACKGSGKRTSCGTWWLGQKLMLGHAHSNSCTTVLCHPGASADTAPPVFHPAPQARFTEAILRQMAGITFPMDRIFSQTVSGRPKSEVRGGAAAC